MNKKYGYMITIDVTQLPIVYPSLEEALKAVPQHLINDKHSLLLIQHRIEQNGSVDFNELIFIDRVEII